MRVTHKRVGSCHEDDSYSSATPAKVASTGLFDVKISYKPADNWRIFAGVNNLFDRSFVSYQAYGSIYPGQGRFACAGSSVSF